MMEEWKEIKGWEGVYQISSCGRLKSFKDGTCGYILSNVNKNGGYLSVVLGGRGVLKRSTRLHILVAESFICPRPTKKHQVNHIDGDKQNNQVGNLEWVTQSENVKHSISMHPNQLYKMVKHNRIDKTKRIIQRSIEDGRILGVHLNGIEASIKTGVCQRNILQVANKTEYKPGLSRKQAGGFRWEFL